MSAFAFHSFPLLTLFTLRRETVLNVRLGLERIGLLLVLGRVLLLRVLLMGVRVWLIVLLVGLVLMVRVLVFTSHFSSALELVLPEISVAVEGSLFAVAIMVLTTSTEIGPITEPSSPSR
jgi:hypothetical protein